MRPGDVVLANTAAGGCYGSERCLSSGVGFGREATNWLTEREVRLVGTDAWSWDAPLSHTAEARPRRVCKVESGNTSKPHSASPPTATPTDDCRVSH